jgi:cystathionine beta-lyase/cystathionine gamma-synthase
MRKSGSGTPLQIATLCAHAGAGDAQPAPRSHITPLWQNSVFDFESIAESEPALAGQGGHFYRRNGVPNTDELAAAVAALEGAAAGLAATSGMGAIAAAILAHCKAGDRFLVQRDAYGGTPALVDRDLARFGLRSERVDAYDAAALAPQLRGARMLLVESLSNPLLRETDVGALAAVCREAGVLLMVDNTFATPVRGRPLAEGADLIVHSATKFLGGHHDLIAGVLCGSAALIDPARAVAYRMGLTAAPFDAWLAVRGLRTLEVRMQRAWATTAELARRLRAHAAVRAVHTAERSALVSFDTGDLAAAERVVRSCSLITLTPSLGGVTTTLSHSASSSHRGLSPAERSAIGVGDGLLRVSVGLESVDDLWADLAAGLG